MRRVDPALAEQRVRLVFQLWEETGSVQTVQQRMGCWSRQAIHEVLYGQVHRKVAPDLQRLAPGQAGRKCSRCDMWMDPRPATEWDDGRPGRCSLGIPESSDPNWARLCSTYADQASRPTSKAQM